MKSYCGWGLVPASLSVATIHVVEVLQAKDLVHAETENASVELIICL